MRCKKNHNRATKHKISEAGKQSTCVEPVKVINPVKLDGRVIAQGSFHQGNRRFGDNSGKQCVANCLASMMYSKKKNVRNWKCSDMDSILITGNELYGFLQDSTTINNNYLLIQELPTELDVFDAHYSMKYHEPVSGTFNETARHLEEFNMKSLKAALEQDAQKYYACFISFNGNTFSVIAQDGMYFVFDSHSRSIHGCMVQDGTSVVMRARSWQEVYRYCTKLAQSMNLSDSEQYELTGLSLCVNGEAVTCTCADDNGSRVQRGIVETMELCFNLEDCDLFGVSVEDDANTGKDVHIGTQKAESVDEYCNVEDDVDKSSNQIRRDDHCSDSAHSDPSDEVEIVEVTGPGLMKFSPLNFDAKVALCNAYHFEVSHLNYNTINVQCQAMGKPKSV